MAMGMRYFGQNYEIEVPVGFDEVTEETSRGSSTGFTNSTNTSTGIHLRLGS